MIYLFLAEGFEELEALAVVDVLRRAEYEVATVAVGTKDNVVRGAHGVPVYADVLESQLDADKMDAIVLPGGLPGTLNLEKSQVVRGCIDSCMEQGKLVAAICAAPSILGHMGYLQGKKAICYPGFEQEMQGALVQADAMVVRDGTIITGRGPGVTLYFALEIVKAISGEDLAEKIGMAMQCPQV